MYSVPSWLLSLLSYIDDDSHDGDHDDHHYRP